MSQTFFAKLRSDLRKILRKQYLFFTRAPVCRASPGPVRKSLLAHGKERNLDLAEEASPCKPKWPANPKVCRRWVSGGNGPRCRVRKRGALTKALSGSCPPRTGRSFRRGLPGSLRPGRFGSSLHTLRRNLLRRPSRTEHTAPATGCSDRPCIR